MDIKKELNKKFDNSQLTKLLINELGESKTVITHKKCNAIPISGIDLLKYCAFFGARINNAEQIDINEHYYTKFIGFGTHTAILE